MHIDRNARNLYYHYNFRALKILAPAESLLTLLTRMFTSTFSRKIPKLAQYLAVQVLHSHFPAENISKAVTFGSPYKTLLDYAKINSTGTHNILV